MNNTLFRLGTADSWCTTTHLMGWKMPLSVRPYSPESIEQARDYFMVVLNSAPDAVLTALWTLCQVKLGRVPQVHYPGELVGAYRKGNNRIVVLLRRGYFEIRFKVKESSKGPQMDLLTEGVA